MRDLKGKNAILTGASRGIGAMLARELARQGVNLVLVARPASAEVLNVTANELSGLGVRALSIPVDLCQPVDRQRLVEQAIAEFGSIDLLVNNAGIGYFAPFCRTGEEGIHRIVETNLVAPMDLVRLTLPGMLERRSGHILNIASMAGKSTLPYDSVYSATKAGVISWSWSLHYELEGSGVGVSVICPGFISSVGFHARRKLKAPWMMREISPESVVNAVLKAIKNDQLEVLIWPTPIRVLLAIKELSPNLVALYYRWFGLLKFARRMEAEAEKTIRTKGGVDELGIHKNNRH